MCLPRVLRLVRSDNRKQIISFQELTCCLVAGCCDKRRIYGYHDDDLREEERTSSDMIMREAIRSFLLSEIFCGI